MNTLVLNSAYIPINVQSVESAFCIVTKGNAIVVENYEERFKTIRPEKVYYKPSIIRIPKYVELKWNKVPFTKHNVFKRDRHQCVYCKSKRDLTIDHVIPKSKGGQDNWGNVVTACLKCNSLKADLTLKEWGKEIPQPQRPHNLLLISNIQNIPDSWSIYLFGIKNKDYA